VKKDKRRVSKKDARAVRGGRSELRIAGQHTLQEILSQPAAWIETARQFEKNDSQLLPFADDRGAVDKTSSGFVHGSAGVGAAFRAARGNAAD
jgi:hypothetical protein